MVTEDEL